jgi:hypothetical protein
MLGVVRPTSTPDPASRILLASDPVIAAAAALGPCDCFTRDLNCSDFPFAVKEGASAQACFLQCRRERDADIHQLDPDNDGNACSYMPGAN